MTEIAEGAFVCWKSPAGFDKEAFQQFWRAAGYRQVRYRNQRLTFHKGDQTQLDKKTLQRAGE